MKLAISFLLTVLSLAPSLASAGTGRNLLVCGDRALINQSEQGARPRHTEYIFGHDASDDGSNGVHNHAYLGLIENGDTVEAVFQRDDHSTLSFLIPAEFANDGQRGMVKLSTGEILLCNSTAYTQRLWLKKLPQ